MLDLVDSVIRAHLAKARKPQTPEVATAEVERVETLNALSLDEFLELPRRDQELAEEVWAAKVIAVNVRRQEERGRRIERELAL
jgi:hypothetical protein